MFAQVEMDAQLREEEYRSNMAEFEEAIEEGEYARAAELAQEIKDSWEQEQCAWEGICDGHISCRFCQDIINGVDYDQCEVPQEPDDSKHLNRLHQYREHAYIHAHRSFCPICDRTNNDEMSFLEEAYVHDEDLFCRNCDGYLEEDAALDLRIRDLHRLLDARRDDLEEDFANQDDPRPAFSRPANPPDENPQVENSQDEDDLDSYIRELESLDLDARDDDEDHNDVDENDDLGLDNFGDSDYMVFDSRGSDGHLASGAPGYTHWECRQRHPIFCGGIDECWICEDEAEYSDSSESDNGHEFDEERMKRESMAASGRWWERRLEEIYDEVAIRDDIEHREEEQREEQYEAWMDEQRAVEEEKKAAKNKRRKRMKKEAREAKKEV